MHGYLLIDGMSIGHAANNGTELTVGSTKVQAIYGFLRAIRVMVKTYPTLKPVVLWDGASWRQMLLASYKLNREKADTAREKKVQEDKATFKKQIPAIKKALTLLGISQVWAINMEADDLAAILTDKYSGNGNKILLVSADRDWIQLVGPGVVWFNPIGKNSGKIEEGDLEEKFGVTSVRQFIEMKALMGDAGDNVPGIGGIGDKGAVEFLKTYGSIADFINQAVFEKTIDVAALPKKYRAIIEDESKIVAFQRNLDLVDLRTPARPAPINLTVTRGEPDADRFKAFCDKLLFRSITKDLAGWLSVFPAFQEQA